MKGKKIAAVMMSMVMAAGMVPATALAADGEGAAEQYHYITMNVPYMDFYEAYGLTDQAVWEVEEGIDAVSTATTSKFLGTTGLAKGTYNNGKYIMGVTLPVAVSDKDYKVLEGKNEGLTEQDNYYFVDLENEPEAYSVMSIDDDDDYSFSKLKDSDISTEYISVGAWSEEDGNEFVKGNVETTSDYGDYLIYLQGVNTAEGSVGIQVGENEYIEDYTIYGAILNMKDGKSYGMTMLENIWVGTRMPYAEIAWSIKGGKGLTNHGGETFYQFDMNGGTLESVSLITDLGVINISCGEDGLELPQYYTGDLSELALSIANNQDILTITGNPEDLDDVKISVSGNLATDAAITDGKVQLSGYPEDGTSYTVTISSSNYPDIYRTVSTPITDGQKDILQSWIGKAMALSDYSTDATLQEHVQEARNMIEAESETSANAEELIGELMLLVKNYYPEANASAVLEGSQLTVTLEGINLSDLENPTYTLSYRQGHSSAVLTSGDLEELSFVLGAVPTVGTEYTLTIVSDNYQDITATVTAEGEEEEPAEVPEEPSTEGTTQTPSATTQAPQSTQTTQAAQTQPSNTTNTTQTSSAQKVSLKKTKAKIKAVKKKSMKIKWNKVANAQGYEIQYSLNKKFKKAKTVTKTVSAKKASVTIKKLKRKKTYYVRVRSFNGSTYSSWSKVVKAVTK